MLDRIRQMLVSESAGPGGATKAGALGTIRRADPFAPVDDPAAPALSIVVIVYDMVVQSENTLRSLMAGYQQSVTEDDYEVIVVENESSRCMRPGFIDSLPRNFSYYLRSETEPTPVHAINFALGLCRGENICLMIDGARMVTPGVVNYVLMGHQLGEKSVVTVPGYHIGNQLQQEAIDHGYDVEQDQALVRSIRWPDAGYRLFDIACFSGSSAPGFFLPNSESNCISIPREVWRELGATGPALQPEWGRPDQPGPL